MKSAALSLDAIVTAIACLCSTTNVREEQVSTLLRLNNHTVPKHGFWDQSSQFQLIEERLSLLEAKIERIEQLLLAAIPEKDVPQPKNCKHLSLKNEEVKGIDIEVAGMIPFIGVCKRIEPYGNWLVIQRRQSNVNFNRGWEDYRGGFGRLEADYFVGLERLHKMTTQEPHKLLVRMKKTLGSEIFTAHYDRFEIDSESKGYALKRLGNYIGNAGDALSYHVGEQFSTFDKHILAKFNASCAAGLHGGWWFKGCLRSNLNGPYYSTGLVQSLYEGIIWFDLTNANTSLVYVEMLIKPVN